MHIYKVLLTCQGILASCGIPNRVHLRSVQRCFPTIVASTGHEHEHEHDVLEFPIQQIIVHSAAGLVGTTLCRPADVSNLCPIAIILHGIECCVW